MYTKDELLTVDGKKLTGSAFLAHTRRLSQNAHITGKVLSDIDRERVEFAINVFSPENFFMDGELFA